MIFTIPVTTRVEDFDQNGLLTPPALLSIFENTAVRHANTVGYSPMADSPAERYVLGHQPTGGPPCCAPPAYDESLPGQHLAGASTPGWPPVRCCCAPGRGRSWPGARPSWLWSSAAPASPACPPPSVWPPTSPSIPPLSATGCPRLRPPCRLHRPAARPAAPQRHGLQRPYAQHRLSLPGPGRRPPAGAQRRGAPVSASPTAALCSWGTS